MIHRVVQIGSNVGRGDVVWDFVAKHRCWALLVEPNPPAFQQLRANYAEFADRVAFENAAISDVSGEAILYFDAPLSEHASLLREVTEQAGDVQATKIPCMTLTALFEKHDLLQADVDWLVIDTEGNDAKIILSTDFSKLRIRRVMFEHAHTDGPTVVGETYITVLRHLVRYGYEKISFTKRDTVLQRPENYAWTGEQKDGRGLHEGPVAGVV